MNKATPALGLSFCLLLNGCANLPSQHLAEIVDTNLALYQQAVNDARVIEAGENYSGLVTLAADNAQLQRNEQGAIKVVTWKRLSAYQQFIEPNAQTPAHADYAFWVTVAPQVQRFCQQWWREQEQPTATTLDLRLKQQLGLHPDWQYDVFVELWMDPADLFRPCVDPSPTDAQCDLDFSEQVASISGIEDYQVFYQALYMKSFRQLPGVPWTGLGYTYDWANNGTDVGQSEFMTKPASPYKVEKVVSTEDYCRPPELN